MNNDHDKPGTTGHGPLAPPPSSGEGAGTALEAMIKKRKLRAEDDLPATASDKPAPDATPGS